MQRVLISGASGPIGTALLASFEPQSTQIVRLVRGRAQNAGQVSWDPLAPLSPTAVSGFDAVVHLAGESVVGRWTNEKKSAIRDSRVLGTRHLSAALAQSEAKPRVLVCASAIGLYGSRGDELLREESPAGQGFLAEVCREWEDASRIAAEAGIRTVNIRIGLVLSAKGGALANMLMPFKLGLGGRIGSGQQWWSWIHVDDIVGGIHHAIGTESVAGPVSGLGKGPVSGPVNLVAPNPVRNAEFTKVLASVLGRPAFFPVPEFALRLAFGKTAAEELLLASQRVEPGKLGASGYTFRFRELRQALENLVG
ncbi:MAG: TIGR01777 family oxidoreductase [Terriglobales bacterium]